MNTGWLRLSKHRVINMGCANGVVFNDEGDAATVYYGSHDTTTITDPAELAVLRGWIEGDGSGADTRENASVTTFALIGAAKELLRAAGTALPYVHNRDIYDRLAKASRDVRHLIEEIEKETPTS